MTSRDVLALAAIASPLLLTVAGAVVPRARLGLAARAAGLVAGGAALALAAVALANPGAAQAGTWLVVDPAAGIVVGVVGLVGCASVLVSGDHLRATRSGILGAEARPRAYYAILGVFWSVLAAVPLAGNLGSAWLLAEATTAASALLVGFSGRPRALEAAWKYLVLTSLGLGVALLGIVVLSAGGEGHGISSLAWGTAGEGAVSRDAALVAYLLVLAGLAAKAGWAPVHNWLPDAHSEAPPPVSALLSAALLPAVVVVAWRTEQALAPTIGVSTARSVLLGFGLVSLAVAVPFLWRPLPWKRLLAYSSLEHMGVLALAAGFATPLALAGLAVHLVGHALAKALGFYAATPLLAHDRRASREAAVGIVTTQPRLGAAMGLSLGVLAGLPPSPLFVSEVLVVAGGFQAGNAWVAAAAAGLLALGFLGLAHALIEVVAGRPRPRDPGAVPGTAWVVRLAAVTSVLLLALTAVAAWLPDSPIVEALAKGAG